MRDQGFFADTPIDELYEWFASTAATTSPVWERVCRWVAATPAVAERLDALPGAKRQPNLYLAALRYLDAPLAPGPALERWTLDHWDEVRGVILTHRTQTNEVGRASFLAPLLANLPQPISLIEVGCSAGCLLFPEVYRYRYTGAHARELGPSDGPLVEADEEGEPPATAVPDIAWRAGIDLNPLDAGDPDVIRWLRSLVWPGEEAREARLVAALEAVRGRECLRLAGDALERLPEALAQVPAGTTPVVMQSVVAAYFTHEQRDAYVALVRESGARWVSLEAPKVLPEVRATLSADDEGHPQEMVLALDGRAVAWAHHHGAWVRWLPVG